MKTKLIVALALLGAGFNLRAAMLTATTAVHSKPDEKAPVVSYLKAGSTPVPTADSLAVAPVDWMAIELTGPFEVYVNGKDINKSLDIREGASLRLHPKAEAPELLTYTKGDPFEITGVRGKWMQLKLDRKLVGFIHVSAPSPISAPIAAPTPAKAKEPAPLTQAPASPGAYGVAGLGQPALMVDLGDGGSAALPRSFQGSFVSTYRPFAPKRPFPYALNDDSGVRFGYLDLSRLMLTDSLEKFLDRPVVVYGIARNLKGTRDIVIEVETLQLR